ncbi:hypothetical protein DSO57_1023271 [Entomophthora muscae]|uniref:Uncharacterized protein n=1 Tax=Entomophthora muscae TaxID=34485 RepID=A0ACC2RTW7_9FUNG|nr:hypothetical protein DSO57_1023271 [Entomophthora muscae]
MLAQRMQKLNLANTPSLPADASARIESYTQEVNSDEVRQAAELSATSEKITRLSKQFLDNFSSLNQLASEVKAFQEEFEKIQSGAKFTTANLKDLLAELSLKSRSLFTPEPPQPPKQEVEVKAAENFGSLRNIFNQQNDADPFAALITKKAEEAPDPFTQLISKKSEGDSFSAPSPPQSPVKPKSSNPWANEAESRAKVVTPPASEEHFPKPSVKDFASLFSSPQKPQESPKESPKIQQAEEAESKPFVIPPPPPPPPADPQPSPTELPVAPPISKAPVETEIPKEKLSNNPFDFKFSVRAIYAYSEEGSALRFEEGDVLNVTDEGDESAEWYLGHLTTAPDIEDWFPRAYVTREVDPVPEPPVQEPPKTTYKLIYEYAPLDDQGEPFGDSLEADVILEVVDDSDADWWLVQDPRPGQDGLFYVPANFLELVT